MKYVLAVALISCIPIMSFILWVHRRVHDDSVTGLSLPAPAIS